MFHVGKFGPIRPKKMISVPNAFKYTMELNKVVSFIQGNNSSQCLKVWSIRPKKIISVPNPIRN